MTTSTPPATSPSGPSPSGPSPIWHTLSIEEALREQGVDQATGLSQTEAARRQKQFGPNKFGPQ
jgi:Cation transporter/ATPase, N-terminus